MADSILNKEIEGISDSTLKKRIKTIVSMCANVNSYIASNFPAVPKKLIEQMPQLKTTNPDKWVDIIDYKNNILEPAIKEISDVLGKKIPEKIRKFFETHLNIFKSYKEAIEEAQKK